MSDHHQRLVSLDVLRGMTIAGMILVNNPGSPNAIYPLLRHAKWNGLTFADLIFPLFMFIMGVSTYISLNKLEFKLNKILLIKILKRTLIIFAIGLLIAWFSGFLALYKYFNWLPFHERMVESLSCIDQIRIMGILQRLAICYLFSSLIILCFDRKYLPVLIVQILLFYFFILYLGDGFEQKNNNIIAKVDRMILGEERMYLDNGMYFEPEGVLSTFPAIAQVLIGFCIAKQIFATNVNVDKIKILIKYGIIFSIIGFILSFICPINKKIWSPSFVLVTCAIGCVLFALLIWLIDIKKYKNAVHCFIPFGMNSLFIFVIAGIISIITRRMTLVYHSDSLSLRQFLYSKVLAQYFGNYPSSFIYALFIVVICWLIAFILYKKHFFITI